MITMGVDIGSSSTEIVVMKDGKEILATASRQTGTGSHGYKDALEEIEKAGYPLSSIDNTIATGYGRQSVEEASEHISEITCHAKGVNFFEPTCRTIIDIGGQDAKAIRIRENGTVLNFCMNDKCAAGTGRFLDVMARVLEVDINELGPLSLKSTEVVSISSTCTVFAESEVISQLAANKNKADIAAGIHRSVANRAASLAFRVGLEEDVVLTGGVALNSGVVKAMSEELGKAVRVPEFPQLTGAVGAAILAFQRAGR